MGEKKIEKYLTLRDLVKKYGLSLSFFQKKTELLEPALLKVAGKAPKPYRYDADKIDEIITTGGGEKKKPTRGAINRERLRANPAKGEGDDGDDDLWR